MFAAQAASPNDPKFSQQWGLQTIKIAEVWTKAKTTATSAVVAVIDTGLDVNHGDLAPNLWRNQTETLGNGADDDMNGCVDDEFGCDFTGNGIGVALQSDPHGHGTHVAGIIGAVGNNKTDTVGVAWTVPIMAIRVFTASGAATSDRVATAIDYAVKNKASVINCSFGTALPSPKLLAAIDRAVKADVLIVAAAGNTDGGLPPDNDTTPVYPASSPGVLAVMASDKLDGQQSISRKGHNSVHLAAPGENIISLRANGGTSLRDGTSMAAPFVSGVAGLARGMAPSFSAVGIAKDLVTRARKVTAMKGLSTSEAILDASFLAPSSVTTNAAPGSTKPVPPTKPAPSLPPPAKAPIVSGGPPSEWIGRVAIGTVALGAETSGVALSTDNGSIELAVTGPMLKELAAMDGQTVRIFGATETRITAARGRHTVVRVTKWERR
ncbi:MAG: S8 family serine peptidase [Cyanobacteria bacterium]|nr:S8 family serine peptidase [Cyanobacteriota bacterium]